MVSLHTGASPSLDSVTASIEIFGPNVLIPIVKTDDGEILDGRLRLQALDALGLPSDSIPSVVIDSSEAELLQLQLNIFRRHLTTSQRAVMALDFEESGEKSNDYLGAMLHPDDRGCLTAPLARLFAVSKRLIQLARRLVLEAPPELVEDVRAGRLTINAALRALEGGDDPSDTIHTNVGWTRERHALLQAFAARCRSSQADLLGAVVDLLHDQPEVLEDLYQRMNPGHQPWIPTPQEMEDLDTLAAVPELTDGPEMVPPAPQVTPVLAAAPVRPPGSTKSVPNAHAHQRTIKKPLNNNIIKDLSTPERPDPPHAPDPARCAPQSAESVVDPPRTLEVIEEETWTEEAVVERYNAACAEWAKAHPEVLPAQRIHPVSVRNGQIEIPDHARAALTEAIETLRRATRGDLGRLQGYLSDIVRLSPEVIEATHRHTLHMFARPTVSRPESGPFLVNLSRYFDWSPKPTPQAPAPLLPSTPPPRITQEVPGWSTHVPTEPRNTQVHRDEEGLERSAYDVEGWVSREDAWTRPTRPERRPVVIPETPIPDPTEDKWTRKASHIGALMRVLGFGSGG